MNITQPDQAVLDQLGLGNIPDQDKQAVLAMIDQRLEKRFLANLLMSLPEDKRDELDKQVEAMADKPDAGKVVEAVLNLHPDAQGILEQSAKEIVEELKKENRSPVAPATTHNLPAGGVPPANPSSSPSSDYY